MGQPQYPIPNPSPKMPYNNGTTDAVQKIAKSVIEAAVKGKLKETLAEKKDAAMYGIADIIDVSKLTQGKIRGSFVTLSQADMDFIKGQKNLADNDPKKIKFSAQEIKEAFAIKAANMTQILDQNKVTRSPTAPEVSVSGTAFFAQAVKLATATDGDLRKAYDMRLAGIQDNYEKNAAKIPEKFKIPEANRQRPQGIADNYQQILSEVDKPKSEKPKPSTPKAQPEDNRPLIKVPAAGPLSSRVAESVLKAVKSKDGLDKLMHSLKMSTWGENADVEYIVEKTKMLNKEQKKVSFTKEEITGVYALLAATSDQELKTTEELSAKGKEFFEGVVKLANDPAQQYKGDIKKAYDAKLTELKADYAKRGEKIPENSKLPEKYLPQTFKERGLSDRTKTSMNLPDHVHEAISAEKQIAAIAKLDPAFSKPNGMGGEQPLGSVGSGKDRQI